MRKIEGRVRNLKVEDSKVFPFRNIERQAVGTAMVGALTASSSMAMNAPIMIMAAKGREAKTFTGEIDGIRVIGQFTTVKFQANDIFDIRHQRRNRTRTAFSLCNFRS
ncbi:hypothetical protein [Acinetobacter sp. NIPH 2699]|uniref:hypothetical protein n=1 Tax=Acinetobacter sp. NIPH 2699 TaxID=2923433 RepID=UPI00321AF7A3